VPVTLSIDGRITDAAPGRSLFDCAEQVGLRVPTSCRKQGRCKECIVDITAGMECVSGPTDQERHLTGRFRLSCQTRIIADAGRIDCHTMRRGPLRIVQLGNAAIEGASIALLSQSKRRELEALVRTVEHCRLESHPHFFDHFVEGCQFKPLAFTGRVAG
jgi:uncharacterized 2Fe-2S/4Fe-4S cluster protein (DUF4445 family)